MAEAEVSERVVVVCDRCQGTGKDPSYANGSAGPDGFTHEPWPCQAHVGGCGGNGWRSRTLFPDSLAARKLELADAVMAKRLMLATRYSDNEWNVAEERIEAALGLSLRPRRSAEEDGGHGDIAQERLGAYSRPAVRWLEGEYLTIRPSFMTRIQSDIALTTARSWLMKR